MKISKVQAQLNNDDILSIINEFVELEFLSIDEVLIKNSIVIKGKLTKGITINFIVELNILKVEDGKLYIKVSKLKTGRLGIFRIIRSFGIKKALEFIPCEGIESKKDVIIIDIHKVLIDIPYVDVNISDVFIRKDLLYLEVDNINVSIKGNIIKDKEKTKDDEIEEEIDINSIKKIKDKYSEGRKKIQNDMPEKVKNISDYVLLVPDIISLIYRLLKDNRVPVKIKLIISGAISYVVVPSDLIPSKIPFIGEIDDIAVVFFALNRIVQDVDLKVLLENWEGSNELIIVLKSSLEYLVNFTKAQNLEKLCSVIEELKTL